MSIRYNRQYKILAPEENESIYLNENIYLNGGGGNTGGGNTGGGGGSIPIDAGIIITPEPEVPTPDNPLPVLPLVSTINYEIALSSNLQNEVGDLIKLKYEIRSLGSVVDGDTILLSDGNTDSKSISAEVLPTGVLNIFLENTLPANYTITKIYYANKQIAVNYPTDYSKWKIGDKFIGTQASELSTGGIAVAVIIEKEIAFAKPVITLESAIYSKQIKESDGDSIINIKFTQKDCNFVDFYINTNNKIRVDAATGFLSLSFKKDFEGIFGSKKIIAVPESDLYGTGDKVEATLNFISVNDFPSITEIVYTDSIDVPSFSDLSIEYEVKYTTFSTSYIDVDLLLKDNTKISLFKKLTPNGSFKINLKELANKFPGWNGSNYVCLTLKPTNTSGVTLLVGNEYEIKTNILYPLIQLDEDIIKKSIFDAFVENIKFSEAEKESKYLTHLVNFGNDEKLLISSWEEDNYTLSKKSTDPLGNEIVKPEDEVKSVILKLYNPLPNNITKNSTFWITKLLTNPLIETVVLNEQDDIVCPPLKGPNFQIEIDFTKGQSTNFESLDTLILSGSVSSSTQLVSTYLSSSLVNTDDLNIEYYSGLNNLTGSLIWDNFVHFSSAKERVDNFVYKVQLIEAYEASISSSLYFSGSSAQIAAGSGSHTGSISAIRERERQQLKKDQLVNGFDGFEKFLYTTSSLTTANSASITWPHSGNIRLLSTNTIVSNGWYPNLIELAEDYDIENPNYVLNNIPQYIRTNTENDSLLLFFTMIGQHFDNIYYYTKSIEKTRSLGYKSKDGISDKLLFDVLKSFNWDAKNLAADSKLWEYTFGLDSNGIQKFDNPAKQRTNEVWRRIVNNLPYLLKHKGTRRGVYALMSCYGIPSSNLSILEFGGPEVTETTKSKLVMDNITTALKFYGQNSGSIKLEWKNTERNRKPDTIEFFVKPAYSGIYNIISGSNWGIKLSGSADSNYGQVKFTYSGSDELINTISSSLLPIFNGNFFGIEVSRTSGSVSSSFELNVRQSNKERTIFQQSISASILNVNTSWDGGDYIYIASGSNGYSGSLDEFRLWSTPLDKERFFEHVSFPEMINGNNVSSSTDDLFFRLDFEYPKNLSVSSSLLNVDTNIYFSSSLYRNDLESGSITNDTLIFSENPSASYSASAFDFPSITSYPFQFETIDRTVVLEIPDLGSGRYSTNKVRFESQTDFNGNDVSGGVDLSIKSRVTKKAFDQAPTDSNRVGLFFSPTKELNIDIAKSLGGINLDNYIGDPGDRTKPNYTSLDNLRHYYFKRFDNRDIYTYINLIKLYEKSMFEDIKKMLPARVKATTGLLIEPHILERSKIAQKDPTGEEYQKETSIHYSDTTILIADNNQHETIVDADLSENVFGENNQYETTIHTASIDSIIAENYQYSSLINEDVSPTSSAESYQREVIIDAGLEDPTILTEIDVYDMNIIAGQSDLETIGFGIYAQNGHAIRTYFDKNGRRVKERIKIDLIKEQKRRDIVKFKVVVNGQGDPRGGSELTSSIYFETKLNIQPFSGSKVINAGTGSIVEVVALDGYLPTHYRNTNDLTRGLQNSFFRGSKNTSTTTLDGSSPIETFISNPNTLTVNRGNRNASEPILEVE